jgi:hypothetical protein
MSISIRLPNADLAADLRVLTAELDRRSGARPTPHSIGDAALATLVQLPEGHGLRASLPRCMHEARRNVDAPLQVWMSQLRARLGPSPWPTFLTRYWQQEEVQTAMRLWPLLRQRWSDIDATTRARLLSLGWSEPPGDDDAEARGLSFLAHNQFVIDKTHELARAQGSRFRVTGWPLADMPWTTRHPQWPCDASAGEGQVHSATSIRNARALVARLQSDEFLQCESLGTLGSEIERHVWNWLFLRYAGSDPNAPDYLGEPGTAASNQTAWIIRGTVQALALKWAERRTPGDPFAALGSALSPFTPAGSPDVDATRELLGKDNIAAWAQECFRSSYLVLGPDCARAVFDAERGVFVAAPVAPELSDDPDEVDLSCGYDPLADE